MKKVSVFFWFGLFGASSAQAEVIPHHFQCVVKSVVQLDKNGNLARNRWTNLLEKDKSSILFDQETGEFRWTGDDESFEFEVMQKGTIKNAVNAIRHFQGPVSYVHDFLVIETFTLGWPFYYDSDGTIYSGNCISG